MGVLYFINGYYYGHGFPIIANFIVEPDICLPLVPPGKNLDEMILTNPKDVQLTGIAPN